SFAPASCCGWRAPAPFAGRWPSPTEGESGGAVDARAWRIVTAPATKPAMTSMAMKTMRSCARTERPCHSACDRPCADSHAGGQGDGILLSDGARMNVLPMAEDLARSGPGWSLGNGSLAEIPAPQRPRDGR